MKELIYKQDVIDLIDNRIRELMNDPEFRKKNADRDLYGVKKDVIDMSSIEIEPEEVIIRRRDAIDIIDEITESHNSIEAIEICAEGRDRILSLESIGILDKEPENQPIGVVKEYDNGMVAMRKETFNEYHRIAVNEAIRRGNYN